MRIAMLREAVGTHIRGLVGGPPARWRRTGDGRGAGDRPGAGGGHAPVRPRPCAGDLGAEHGAGCRHAAGRPAHRAQPASRLRQRYPVKKIAAAGALLMVTLYMMIAGGAVSAVRSFVMIVVMLLAVFVDRPSISLRNNRAVRPPDSAGHALGHHRARISDVLCRHAGPGGALSPARLAGRGAGGARASVAEAGFPVWIGFVGLVLSSLIGGLSVQPGDMPDRCSETWLTVSWVDRDGFWRSVLREEDAVEAIAVEGADGQAFVAEGVGNAPALPLKLT